ncbi:MAG: YqaA family protein [Mariprofundaceae bacterium]
MNILKPRWLRRCYDWTLSWAEHPQAQTALFFIAVIEASVFPIPPDILLLALALGRPELGLRLAAISTAGSMVGACIGYLIGMLLFVSVAQPVLEFYGAMEQFSHVQTLFQEYGLWVVLIAGFSPIPFKIITIAAGAFGLPFIGFFLAALLSRGARFFLEGMLLQWGGSRLRSIVDRHFEWLTVAIVVLVVAGFASLWMLH